MDLTRREFVRMMGIAGAAGLAFPGFNGRGLAAGPRGESLYEVPAFGNLRLLHMADCHAQLLPIYYREPNVNLGVAGAKGKSPHLVGEHLLGHFGIAPDTIEAHAFSYLGFTDAAELFGRVGGFSHLATLVKQLRAEARNSLLLDSGDTWQGSGTALWTRGMDMVEACNRLGVDAMTGHWEFTYGEDEIRANIEAFRGDFIAQNVRLTEEALFDGVAAFDEDSGHAFRPYVMKEVGGTRVAIIGQAFPYTPIANPSRFIPNWSFGIQEKLVAKRVAEARADGAQLVVLLSHNGFDVDRKLAARVPGIDVVLTGHTHDAMPAVVEVGKTLLVASGSHGKFLSRLDLEVKDGKLAGYRYRLIPVFSDVIQPDPKMAALVERIRAPHKAELGRVLGRTESLLYRRGNFNGTFDDLICQALLEQRDAQISLSPGFRWGATLIPGQEITVEDVYNQTAITYPTAYRTEFTGAFLKEVLEDVADNIFNPDPYYQQGGDMVRAGGLGYTIDIGKPIGKRISDMTLLADGKPVDPVKSYVVSGWASVNEGAEGPPVYDVVSRHIEARKTVKVDENPNIKIRGA